MLLQGLLWMDLSLVGAVLGLMLRWSRIVALRYGAFYLFFVESYILLWLVSRLSAGGLPVVLYLPLAAILLIMPWAFWIFALSVFEDGFRPGRWHMAVLLAKLALAVASHLGRPGQDLFSPSTDSQDILRLLPNVLFSFALVFHVMIIAWRGRTYDLVELRIDLRRIFALLMGGLILWFMMSFLVLRPLGLGNPVDLVNATLLGLMAAGFLFSSVRLRQGYFAESDTEEDTTPEASADPVDPQLEKAVLQAFEKDHIYRTEGLTIGQLARHMGAQEYRVRRIINRQMGFRNFNELLNRYRIQEACELLSAGDLPVIRVATEIGYPSPGPFNRAFRQITGATPTEYRRRRDSERP